MKNIFLPNSHYICMWMGSTQWITQSLCYSTCIINRDVKFEYEPPDLTKPFEPCWTAPLKGHPHASIIYPRFWAELLAVWSKYYGGCVNIMGSCVSFPIKVQILAFYTDVCTALLHLLGNALKSLILQYCYFK